MGSVTEIRKSATISDDGRFRYDLIRDWTPLGVTPTTAVWLLLNPSTADAEEDDPTIRRVVAFTRAWGLTRAAVVNLYAFRATDPVDLRRAVVRSNLVNLAEEVVGPENDRAILRWTTGTEMVVAGWGVNVETILGGLTRVRKVLEILDLAGAVPLALKTSKTGHPGHPLYLPRTAIPYGWTPNLNPGRV